MDKIKEEMLKGRVPVCEQCIGEGFSEEQQKFLKAKRCGRIIEMSVEVEQSNVTVHFCSSYMKPSIWWNHPSKRCPLADHYRPDLQTSKGRQRVGQQKQKKN